MEGNHNVPSGAGTHPAATQSGRSVRRRRSRVGQSHGQLGFRCSGRRFLFLTAGNHLTVLGGCGCCVSWPPSPQVPCPSLPRCLPQGEAFVPVPARLHVPWRLRVSLGTSVRESPRPAPRGSPSLRACWAGEGAGTAPGSGRAPEVCPRNLAAKSPAEEQTCPFSPSPSAECPRPPPPASVRKGHAGHVSSRCCWLPAAVLPRRGPGASRHPQRCLATGQPPHPQPPCC